MNDRLVGAVTAARGKSWDETLSHLLVCFRANAHPRIASLVSEVSKLAEKGLPAIEGKNHDARVDAAEKLLAEGRPRDLPRVLRLLHELRMAQARRLLEALAAVPSDPRFHDAALLLLRDPPFTSSTAMPVWRRYLEVVDQQRDPRTRPALAALDFSWLADWSAESFRTAVARMGLSKGAKRATVDAITFVELTAEETAALDAIEAALGGSQVDGEALFAAIRNDPSDDSVRAVYADWLEEQGDPRGQFISLQLATHARAATEDERKSMKALLDKHGQTWLGELGSILQQDQIRFERGFVARAAVTSDDLPRLADCVDAVTIDALFIHGREPFDASLLRAKNLRGLRFVGGIEPIMLETLASEGPFDFEGVGIDLFDVLPGRDRSWTDEQRAMRDRVVGLRATFPRFTELAIRAFYRDPEDLAFVWESPLVDGLERLRLAVGSTRHWIAHQDVLPRSLRTLECSFDFGFRAWQTELARDDDGRFSKVVATLRPKARDFAPVALDDVIRDLLDEVAPDALTELEVRADGVRIVQTALDAIVQAARRHTRLTRLRLPGRAPLDLSVAAKPSAPVLTAKERDRIAHAKVTESVVVRLRDAAKDLLPEAALADVDLGQTATLSQIGQSWLPKSADVDPRWAEVALVLLSLPLPAERPEGYGRAHRELAEEALRLFGRAKPDTPFTRLHPLLDGLYEDVAMSVIAELGRALVTDDEIPALLDWFESFKVKGASDTYYAVKDLLHRRGLEVHPELKRRLSDHKLNRFHRWAYESALRLD
ncbi:MAG: TIGR02996 domain-containing protein [Polyangiales bacterium]